MSEDQRPDGDLEGGLFEAFKREREESVLATIERLHGPLEGGGSVFLKETAAEVGHVRLQRPDTAIANDSRFRVLGEIARGGIGIVYQGHDVDLNRDVALKVLRPEYKDDENVVQRFIEEAQVGGQLQHPGIVPIYALTLQPDGRPCFAMKLVKGQTLASLLEANPRGLDLKAIFEQVAQTMAYAHSRGVIHRDLKPANVMVGAFGEVQVVDWGFAKVLGGEESKRPTPVEQTIVATVRSDMEGSASIAGSVMGTPAYMPPEQALGQIENMDERADVFTLGAILCEILTDEPPYTGEVGDQLIAASQSRLDEAHARLEACDEAAGLVQLVRDCLAPKRADRPKNAGEVAERIAAHFERVEQRAREAELGVAKARADAALSTKSRRRSLVLAGLVLLAVLTGGGGFGWMQVAANARAERVGPEIAAALQEATGHEGRGDWPAAVAAAQRAADLAHAEGVDAARAESLLIGLEEKARVADEAARVVAEDRAFLAELEEIRGRHGQVVIVGAVSEDGPSLMDDHGFRVEETEYVVQDEAATEAAYGEAFTSRFGSLSASVERLASSEEAEAFAAFLGHWAWLRRVRLDRADWEELEVAAREVDPGHADLRAAMVRGETTELTGIVESYGDQLPPALAGELGNALVDADAPEVAQEFLARVVLRAPDDFYVHSRLARAAYEAKAYDDATQHYTAALALRPRHTGVWSGLGWSLHHASDYAGALEVAERWTSVDPSSARAHNFLGVSLCRAGELDDGIAAFRHAAELDPGLVYVHTNLGSWLWTRHRAVAHARGIHRRDDAEGAIEAYRRATDLDPENFDAHHWVSNILLHSGSPDEGLAMARDLVERFPDQANFHLHLAHALGPDHFRDKAGALAALRRAEELRPDAAAIFEERGVLLSNEDDDAALVALRRAIELDDRSPRAWQYLAMLLVRKGDHAEAAEAARRSIEIDPNRVDGHDALAEALARLGDFEDSLASQKRAVALRPDNAWRLFNLASMYERLGDSWAAIEIYRRAIELGGEHVASAYVLLGGALYARGDFDKSIPELRRALELGPSDSWAGRAHNYLAHSLEKLGELEEAVKANRMGIELGVGHEGCLARVEHKLESLERIEQLERGEDVEVLPEHLAAVGEVLFARGEQGRAVDVLRRVLEHELDDLGTAIAYNWLGHGLEELGDLEGAVAATRKALEHDVEVRGHSEKCLLRMERALEGQRVAERFRAGDVVEGPSEVLAAAAHYLFDRGERDEAVELFLHLFERYPEHATPENQDRWTAICSAALTEDERWHSQVLVWLKEEVAMYRALVDSDPLLVERSLRHFRYDLDVTSIRDGDELPRGFAEVWAEVDALLEEPWR